MNIFFLTGLPCSGKTTIAKELAKRINAEILDGDEIRNELDFHDFSPEGRRIHMLEVARRAYELSKDKPVIVALVSPIKSVREEIKNKYSNVIEVFVKCSLEECERRDKKGMYAKARKGEIKNFTGINAPYEEPDKTTLCLDTEKLNVEQCVERIIKIYV